MSGDHSLIRIEPADPAAWPATAQVLGARGSVRGCWCMFFRQSPQERRTQWGEGNRRALRRLVEQGEEPGLLAYAGDEPVGWCSVAPREEYGRLDRSPISKRLDDQPVFALVCLYVVREHRGQGVARSLVRGALDHAARRGARIVEAYPIDDRVRPVSSDRAYHGVVSLLESEAFTEVARPAPDRPVMRCDLAARDTGVGSG
jgi:GNAT superfamily N-acetyltransferase